MRYLPLIALLLAPVPEPRTVDGPSSPRGVAPSAAWEGKPGFMAYTLRSCIECHRARPAGKGSRPFIVDRSGIFIPGQVARERLIENLRWELNRGGSVASRPGRSGEVRDMRHLLDALTSP